MRAAYIVLSKASNHQNTLIKTGYDRNIFDAILKETFFVMSAEGDDAEYEEEIYLDDVDDSMLDEVVIG